MTPQQFVEKWRDVQLNEKAAYQSHFNDICALIGHKTPVEADPSGTWFTFEAGADKQKGGRGWADVWKKGFFGWEYKGKHANLAAAYDQLLQYRESLLNPPLLVVCDLENIVVHTNFTNTAKQRIVITLDDLLTPNGREQLAAVFNNFAYFKSPETTQQVTERAAREFARIAQLMSLYGVEPHRAAHFLIRILFCMFAEDVGLLPNHIFSKLTTKTWMRPAELSKQLQALFRTMATGGWFGADEILKFNGGLFNDETVEDLDSESLKILAQASALDWASIEPSIFGTLFERSLDPNKRSQIGAHYTGKQDILLIVEPVLMQPLRQRWLGVQKEAKKLAEQRDAIKGSARTAQHARTRATKQLETLLMGFMHNVASVQVLDPACGSGNFLYVALRELLDLQKQVITLMGELKLTRPYPTVHPSQLHGIEINAYAYELAQATVWIGYIQWLNENGFGRPPEPILQPLHNFSNMDAILAFDEKGKPLEPQWQKTDVIVGNPPFLGGNKIRDALGDSYTDSLFTLYKDRVPAFSDLVCYWFEKARAMIETGKTKRAGLLATQAIRGGVNRKALERIKETGDIFWAQSDRDWVLDGAAVRVSMVGFDGKGELTKSLDGVVVASINTNLTSNIDLTKARKLEENFDIAFTGTKKGGSFDIPMQEAKRLLALGGNPHGKSNSEVVKRWVNGNALLGKPKNTWIIDFGVEMSQGEAALFEAPFEYVKKYVRPLRMKNRREIRRKNWWLHSELAPAMRNAVSKLTRYVATPRISKYRIFVWVTANTLPDDGVYIFVREDDYFFGVLHSRLHQHWATKLGTSLTDRPRYTATTTFETFPFPFPPGDEPSNDNRVMAIAEAARELVRSRDNWLNPSDIPPIDLKKHTLTNLYNQNPQWLQDAHRKLDDAVLAAYGWDSNLSDAEILEKLLALNLERAQGQA